MAINWVEWEREPIAGRMVMWKDTEVRENRQQAAQHCCEMVLEGWVEVKL